MARAPPPPPSPPHPLPPTDRNRPLGGGLTKSKFLAKNSTVAPRGSGAHPKMCFLSPKPAFFGPKQSLNPFKKAKQRETAATLHVRLELTVTRSSLLPSTSTICSKKKRLKVAQIVHNLCQPAPKQRMGRILGYVAQIKNPRAPSPPTTPHFLWFPSLFV